MAREDHYAILGVKAEASAAEIKSAYRRLALENHPDRFPNDEEAEARFRLVSAAYTTLGDLEKRARYDRSMKMPEKIELSSPPTLQTAKDVFRNVFGDVFGDVFGNRKKKRRRGRDVRYTLTINLPEAVLGSTHTISFDGHGSCSDCGGSGTKKGGRAAINCSLCEGRGELKSGMFTARTRCGRCDGTGMVQIDPCENCRGRGLTRGDRKFDVRITAGTEAGSEKIVRGEGEPGRFGGDAGNLRVTVNIRRHRWLERHGEDIHMTVPISMSQAALGAKVPVPTVDGWVDLEIPAGIASGTRLRLAGKGVPRIKGGRGHQLVRVDLETPKVDVGKSESPAVARKVRALLTELEALMSETAILPERNAFIEAKREDEESSE